MRTKMIVRFSVFALCLFIGMAAQAQPKPAAKMVTVYQDPG
jgi:hypothetical protein